MFRNLARQFEAAGGAREQVFLVHPVQLDRWLLEAWEFERLVPELSGSTPGAPYLGDDGIIGVHSLPVQLSALLQPSGISVPDSGSWTPVLGPPDPPGVGLIHHHLIYAYLIESIGIFEIFAEVVRRLVVGETLGTLSIDGAKWLRGTEELFFRDPPPSSISGVVSEVRPSARVNRRNAYWRMFGEDVPHLIPPRFDATGGRQEWKEHVGLGVNTDFRTKWSELLRQVWLGQVHSLNTSGANPTDPSYVASLCSALGDILRNRRRGGLLARDEFAHVNVMSWFHLTVESDTPIVKDLKAEASSPADRLSLIAQHVGMAPAARAREMFELAEPMSSVLRAIELKFFDESTAASTLLDSNSALGVEMRDIINKWQSATGERVKEVPSGITGAAAGQPLRIPAPAPALATPSSPLSAAVAAPNGHRGTVEVRR